MVSKEKPNFLAFKYENKKIVSAFIKINSEGIIIKFGDRIFEPEYKASFPHYEKKFWKKVVKKYNKDFKRADKESKTKMMREGYKKYIPIQQLGRHKIETKEDLILSAERIFDFLSK